MENVEWVTTRQIDAMMREQGIWSATYLAWRDRVRTERTPSGARRTDPGMKVLQDLVRGAGEQGYQVRRTEPRPGSIRESGPMWLGLPADDPVGALRTLARAMLSADDVSAEDAA